MSSETYRVLHSPGSHNSITLNDAPFCTVFDDRWRTLRLEPRTWEVRLNQDTFTLLQAQFLSGSHDVLCTLHDGQATQLERKGGMVIGRRNWYGFVWRDGSYRWTKAGKGRWTLAASGVRGEGDGEVLAVREDTGAPHGLLSTVTVINATGLPSYPDAQTGPTHRPDEKQPVLASSTLEDTAGLPSILMLGTALCIDSASIDGGILTSRPPAATREYGFAYSGASTAVSTGMG